MGVTAREALPSSTFAVRKPTLYACRATAHCAHACVLPTTNLPRPLPHKRLRKRLPPSTVPLWPSQCTGTRGGVEALRESVARALAFALIDAPRHHR